MTLIIDIKVVPQAGFQKWILDKSGLIKCYVKSPPENNKANNELIAMVADALRLPKASVSIISGATARRKKIRVTSDITLDDFKKACGLEVQNALL
ncbi:MAG: DUF167 domain-containing protein [Candidatus Babeliaceae bacterium]|jgi:hypothetical protein